MNKTKQSQSVNNKLHKRIIILYSIAITLNLITILFTVPAIMDIILNTVVLGINVAALTIILKEYRKNKRFLSTKEG
ncbi:hypothetical protein JMA_40450 (plasmid) [Jeotgalibacillus malaysiensis]|uniref:Uncharacterized protein n=1 Tax=Jeotgalibacillus malaysiensis TaxID=1508404 RepID=A0A0B5AXV2_9BACL|nr:hypothetical protein JMA_40450 [Jeotgalibacillus malaysiensis]